MHTVETLLEKFWAGTATPEENARLEMLLSENEGELQKVLFYSADSPLQAHVDSENAGQQHYSSEADKKVLLKVMEWDGSEAVLEKIHEKIGGHARLKGIVRGMKRMTVWRVAAAAIIIAALGYLIFQNSRSGSKRATPVTAEIIRPVKRAVNNSDKVIEIHLMDGSLVKLLPHSEISYYEPFENNARDIGLVGQAWFKVAKDASRPFTVHANNVATTAVGTAFTVNTQVYNKVTIKLFEGRVVVRYTDAFLAVNTVYLSPGQQYVMDKALGQPVVTRFEDADTENIAASKAAAPRETAKLPQTILDFEKDSLATVLDRISVQYKTKIKYNRAEVEKLRFTGKFIFPSDQLPVVLSVICNMTEMHYERSSGSVKITKLN